MREREEPHDLPSREAVFDMKTRQEREAEYARDHATKIESLNGLKAKLGSLFSERSPELEREERAAMARAEAEKLVLWKAETKASTNNCIRWVNAFSTSYASAARDAVVKWLAEDTDDNLVLRGGVGSEKTSAACYAVRTWCEPQIVQTSVGLEVRVFPRNVTWLRPDQLVTALKREWATDAKKLHRFIVIDDMGTETSPDFVDCLCDLLETDDHKILITSNVLKPDWQTRYPDTRLLSRMRDCCIARDITTPDMRRPSEDF